jgi:transcriptional regulator with XRE-family HTH domain
VTDLRNKRSLSQRELAKRAGITTVYLSDAENAHSKAGPPTFLKLADAHGCGIDALLLDYYTNERKNVQIAMPLCNLSRTVKPTDIHYDGSLTPLLRKNGSAKGDVMRTTFSLAG